MSDDVLAGKRERIKKKGGEKGNQREGGREGGGKEVSGVWSKW